MLGKKPVLPGPWSDALQRCYLSDQNPAHRSGGHNTDSISRHAIQDRPLPAVSVSDQYCLSDEKSRRIIVSTERFKVGNSKELFSQAYQRAEVAYGCNPSAALVAFVKQCKGAGFAVDLGAGAGRDAIALALAGYRVRCYDTCEQGLQRIRERAHSHGVLSAIETELCDVRDVVIQPRSVDLIVATTVLDHIPAPDAERLWQCMTRGLSCRGVMYVEVHTTDDPGCADCPAGYRHAPVSETASAVINYFPPHQLVKWATAPEAQLRVLHYEERLEWDTTHGAEHLHGKAILLAEQRSAHQPWHGENPVGERLAPLDRPTA